MGAVSAGNSPAGRSRRKDGGTEPQNRGTLLRIGSPRGKKLIPPGEEGGAGTPAKFPVPRAMTVPATLIA